MWSKGFSCIKVSVEKTQQFLTLHVRYECSFGQRRWLQRVDLHGGKAALISAPLREHVALCYMYLRVGQFMYVCTCTLSLCSANFHAVPLTKSCERYLLQSNKFTWKREGMQMNGVWTCLSVVHRWLRAKGVLGCGAGCSRKHVVHFGRNLVLYTDRITTLSRVRIALPHQYLQSRNCSLSQSLTKIHT